MSRTRCTCKVILQENMEILKDLLLIYAEILKSYNLADAEILNTY